MAVNYGLHIFLTYIKLVKNIIIFNINNYWITHYDFIIMLVGII